MKSLSKILKSKYREWFKYEYRVAFEDDLPYNINDKIIYIIGNLQPWLVAFKCPCGCQSLIQLNLLLSANPCWKYNFTIKGKINISPSIRRINGCKSHFFVRKSKINWIRLGTNQVIKLEKIMV